MRLPTLVPLSLLLLPAGAQAQAQNRQPLARQVFEAESAFAQTLAARDSLAFVMYVADDAVFMSRRGTLRGRAAVVAGWHPFFEGRAARSEERRVGKECRGRGGGGRGNE